MTYTEKYAKQIRKRRKAIGFTQKTLAEVVGIDPANLNRIEKAKVSPTIDTVEKIEKSLELCEALYRDYHKFKLCEQNT
jgi:transcriptional regulator with XRE-family HTH domain